MLPSTAVAEASEPLRPPRDVTEHRSLVDALEDPARWPAAAASLLATLGFRLVSPDASARSRWHLLVALRDGPTLRHFDPELLAYYAQDGARASLVSLDRGRITPDAPAGRRALWGHVHVVDRVPVENRFLTFGGELRTASVQPGLDVVDLASPAPIVRWGGHSQATDDLAQAIGAFFGRLMVPVDFVPGAEQLVDAQTPDVLYRAFLADGLWRLAAAQRRGADGSSLAAWFAGAWTRAREDAAACDAAQRLLRELRIGRPSR